MQRNVFHSFNINTSYNRISFAIPPLVLFFYVLNQKNTRIRLQMSLSQIVWYLLYFHFTSVLSSLQAFLP